MGPAIAILASPTIDYTRSCQEISEDLYLGPISAAENPELLKKLNIRAIVTVMESHLASPISEINYFHISVKDDNRSRMPKFYESLDDFIEQQEGAVLLHCSSGISRSSAVLIEYLMKKEKISLLEAFKKVSDARPVILPNDTFFSDLLKVEIESDSNRLDSNSMDHEQYKVFSLRSFTGGNYSLDECSEALQENDGDPNRAYMSLLGL